MEAAREAPCCCVAPVLPTPAPPHLTFSPARRPSTVQLSVLVHPDKNPGEEARQAFEALNEAHRALKDASKLVSQLKR